MARQLVGDPKLEIDLISANTWTVKQPLRHQDAERPRLHHGRCAHRHPPSNGLGSNTSIQDSFQSGLEAGDGAQGGRGTEAARELYRRARAVAKQIVTRANKSIAEFGPIFEALGMDGGVDHEKSPA